MSKKKFNVVVVALMALATCGHPVAAHAAPFDIQLGALARDAASALKAGAEAFPAILNMEPAQGGAQIIAAAAQARPVSLGTFNSVAIPVGTIAMSAHWNGVTDRDYRPLYTGSCGNLSNCASSFATTLQRIHGQAAQLSAVEALRHVNRAINQSMRYVSDSTEWNTGDYWANPVEIAARGAGDCEDFATAKMWMLRALGFPAEALQIVVLKDIGKNVYHAVLAVHFGGERYILDNLSNTIALDTRLANYMPIVSFAESGTFLHGFDRERSRVADLPSDLTSVRPGEGA